MTAPAGSLSSFRTLPGERVSRRGADLATVGTSQGAFPSLPRTPDSVQPRPITAAPSPPIISWQKAASPHPNPEQNMEGVEDGMQSWTLSCRSSMPLPKPNLAGDPTGPGPSSRPLLSPLPPAPWSWRLQMGFPLGASTQARMTRFIFCSISGSPRCTAPKSRLLALSPCTWGNRWHSSAQRGGDHTPPMHRTRADMASASELVPLTCTDEAAPPPTPIL